MKKISLTFVALLIAGLSAFAQKGLSIGVRGGIGLPQFSGNVGTFDKKSLLGTVAGGVLNIGFTESFSVQPEVLYASQKLQFTDTVNNQNVDLEDTKNFIRVPVLFKISTKGQGVKLFATVGPEFGFQFDSKLVSKLQGQEVQDLNQIINQDNIDAIDQTFKDNKKFDYGVSAGGGIGFAAGQGSTLTIDARYFKGLSDITEGSNNKNFNNGWSFSVAYLYSFGL